MTENAQNNTQNTTDTFVHTYIHHSTAGVGTGVIELDRPRALNSLAPEMINDIFAALQAWKDDDQVQQVLISSRSDRAFCAGGDVRVVRDAALAGDKETPAIYFANEYDMNALISTYPKPYIAVIDGVAMGGGLGVSAHGSHRIVTEKAFASMPEMAIGYVTDVLIPYMSVRMVGTRGVASPALAKFWGITGYRMYAADMLYTGLATGFTQDPAQAIADIKERGIAAWEAQAPSAAEAAASLGEAPLAPYVDEIEAAFAHDTWAEIDAAMSPQLRELVEPLIASASPTSIVAAIELYRAEEAAEDIFAAAVAEKKLGPWLVARPDFAEGVRAVLVDKTKDPAFQPATVAEVDADEIRAVLA